MGLKSKLPYHRRLLLLLLVSSWVLVACFIVFQYGREKHFKAEQLNSQLQLFNIQFLDALAGGANIDSLARQHKKPFEEQRITVIDLSGKVLFDSSSDPKSYRHSKTEQDMSSAATRKVPTSTTSTRLRKTTR